MMTKQLSETATTLIANDKGLLEQLPKFATHLTTQEKTTMPIQLSEEEGGKLLNVHVSGKLTSADYEHFVPEFERLVGQHGKLRVLFDMTDFHGWDAGALWADTSSP